MAKKEQNNSKLKKANFSTMFFVILLWVWTLSAFYTIIFTKYGFFSFISLLRQNYKNEQIIQNLKDEKFAIYHRINLIKNNDTDLIEELSQKILNRASENSRIIMKNN